MDDKEQCGTCRFNSYEYGEFSCSNTDSDNYGIPTAYDDSCEDWEEK